MTTDTDAVTLTAEKIEKGWRDTFSTDNPYCPCNLKSFTKAVRWAEWALAPTSSAQEEAVRAPELSKELANIIHDLTVAMQAAIIEWQHGKGAEAAFSWIVNTLEGPGHLPDFDAPYGKQAQFWFDANRAEPFPKCSCGNPSHMLWMGQGFCCDAHYDEAKAKRDAAPAASAGDQGVDDGR